MNRLMPALALASATLLFAAAHAADTPAAPAPKADAEKAMPSDCPGMQAGKSHAMKMNRHREMADSGMGKGCGHGSAGAGNEAAPKAPPAPAAPRPKGAKP